MVADARPRLGEECGPALGGAVAAQFPDGGRNGASGIGGAAAVVERVHRGQCAQREVRVSARRLSFQKTVFFIELSCS